MQRSGETQLVPAISQREALPPRTSRLLSRTGLGHPRSYAKAPHPRPSGPRRGQGRTGSRPRSRNPPGRRGRPRGSGPCPRRRRTNRDCPSLPALRVPRRTPRRQDTRSRRPPGGTSTRPPWRSPRRPSRRLSGSASSHEYCTLSTRLPREAVWKASSWPTHRSPHGRVTLYGQSQRRACCRPRCAM